MLSAFCPGRGQTHAVGTDARAEACQYQALKGSFFLVQLHGGRDAHERAVSDDSADNQLQDHRHLVPRSAR